MPSRQIKESSKYYGLYHKTLELQRKAESYFQHTKSTFSSDTQSEYKTSDKHYGWEKYTKLLVNQS